jgi:ELWxxDGT repeat protein
MKVAAVLILLAPCPWVFGQAEPILLADAAPGADSFYPYWGVRRLGDGVQGVIGNLTQDEPLVYFERLDGFGYPTGDLWRTDGTQEGTFRVWQGRDRYLRRVAEVETSMYFLESNGELSRLWFTSGTRDGARLLSTFQEPPWEVVSLVGQIESSIFFRNGPELWFTSGTPESTQPLGVTLGSSFPPLVVDGKIYFPGVDPAHGTELWVSNGTPGGTHIVIELAAGPEDTALGFLSPFGGQLIFVTWGGTGMAQLWTTDGDLTRSVDGLPAGGLHFIGATDDYVLLRHFPVSGGCSVWVTDLTGPGTRPISHPTMDCHGTVYELGDQFVTFHQLELPGGERVLQVWAMNNEEAVLLNESIGFVWTQHFPAVDGKHFYIVGEADPGVIRVGALWVTDGTPDGTRLVHESVPWCSPVCLEAVGLRGSLVFTALDAAGVRHLWISDGRPAGTLRLDARPEHNAILGVSGDRAYFWAEGGLWSTDATASGTELYHSFSEVRIVNNPVESDGSTSATPTLWPEKGLFLFSGDDGIHGAEPWALPLLDQPRRPFHRGDPNSSGTTDISDGVDIFGFLFLGSPAPTCRESADINNNGAIDISDGMSLLNWLFIGGSEPAAPGPTIAPCGVDPDLPGSPGDLGCEAYDRCN